MIDINLVQSGGYRWFSNGKVSVKGTALLHEKHLLKENDLLAYFDTVDSEAVFLDRLRSLNGLFSVVISTGDMVFAAADPIRSFPLIYIRNNEGLIITDDFRTLIKKYPCEIDPESETAMRHITWVPGKRTLFRNVFQLQAGEYLSYRSEELKTTAWWRITPSITKKLSRDEWKTAIRGTFLKMGKRLSLSVGKRPVALPLSGGYDSRLIGLLLKINGHKNVFCFTFGYPDCKEAHNSKEIARRLGYPWMFIDYAPYTQTDFTRTKQFTDYVDYAGNAISFPYFQEYFATVYLKETVQLPQNTVFIPGHSGDSIGGCSFRKDLKSFHSEKELTEKIFRMYGHGVYPEKGNKELILNMIGEGVDPQRLQTGSLAYEDWQNRESHAKQLVNSSRVFDYFGYEFLQPLSDKHYYDLFASLPNEYRIYRNLHEEVLLELFSEYGIKLDDEVNASSKAIQRAHQLIRIRELFPFVSKLRKRKFSAGFYPYGELLEYLKNHLPPADFKAGNAVISAWYIDHIKQLIQ